MKETIETLWAKGFSAPFIRLLMDTGRIEDPSTVTLIDPPSGWKYGFPQPIDPTKTIEQQLRDAGYPENDIPFALENTRTILSHPKR